MARAVMALSVWELPSTVRPERDNLHRNRTFCSCPTKGAMCDGGLKMVSAKEGGLFNYPWK